MLLVPRLNGETLHAAAHIGTRGRHNGCVGSICWREVVHLGRGNLRQVANDFLRLLTVLDASCSMKTIKSGQKIIQIRRLADQITKSLSISILRTLLGNGCAWKRQLDPVKDSIVGSLPKF